MKKKYIKHFISYSKYSTIYLPISKKGTNEVFAYEALSKFELDGKEIPCIKFFSKLHSNCKLFFLLEKKNKQHQINNSDVSKKLILHFDAVVFKKKEYRIFWKEYLSKYKNRIIISITHQETLSQIDFQTEQKIIKWLIKHKFEFMISLFFDSAFTVSFEDIRQASYIKIHKQILSKITQNHSYKKILNSIITFANQNNTQTLIKHIDSKEEFNLIRKLELNFLQGKVLNDTNT
jgi:EAL domain-containing protein (putative c-di-GMP-specific phosphodiesterase class I)